MIPSDVVILNDFARANGGSSQVAIADAIALAARKCRVTFLAGVGPVAPQLAASGVNVVLLDQDDILADSNRLRAAARGLWNGAAASKLGEVLARLDPARAVVHVHSLSKALSASVVRAASARSFRIVCTLHDYFTACPNGGFFDYQARTICTRRSMSASCVATHCDRRNYSHKLWRVARHWLGGTIGGLPGRIDGFLYATELSLAVLRPYLPPHAHFQRILNPIDVARAAPADPGAHDSFTAVGRIVPEKGFDLLARAARAAMVQVTIVGDGEQCAALQSTAPEIDITGWMSHAETIARLRRSRALVFPSLLYETQGLAVWEAASQGIPVIVADTCAAREGVEDGVTGLWFRGADVDSLAEKIRVLQDPETARRMGRAAYERFWRDPMTPEHRAASLLACYETVLERPR
jgi:glycosyltransferase involved in cell wall biosynthesis